MQVYLRIAEYIWLFRRQFILSVICAVMVSMFWAVNLSIAFPVVKVLFENDSIHAYVAEEIGKCETEIQKENEALKSLRADQVERLAVSQTRLSVARRSLAFSTWMQHNILPWIPTDKFDTIMGSIKFGGKGEWAEGKMMTVQYHDIPADAGLDAWRGMGTQYVLEPKALETGKVIYPYEKAIK